MYEIIDNLTLPRFLEAVNGTLFILDAFLLGVFIRYIWKHVQGAWTARQVTTTREMICYLYRELQGAVAIATFFFGATILRGTVWLWRYYANVGHPERGWDDRTLLIWAGTGIVICSVGAFCMLRVFSEKGKKTRIQIAAGLLVLLVAAFALLREY